MIEYEVKVHKSAEDFPREAQLAWRLAELASERIAVDRDVVQMVENRVIDDLAVAAAALQRSSARVARDQALCHPYQPGARLFGLGSDKRCSPEWTAWANGVAVRELDFHDTFLAEEYSHPGDNIPPLLAVAQHRGIPGEALIRGIVTAYEVQIDLAKAISLHKHKIDHVAHLGASVAAGLGTILGLSTETIYQAIQQAVHVTTATRQSRKGEISSWKAYAPAFAAKAAIEAVDRAMRGEGSPSPIYEGEDGFIAWMLDGSDARYVVRLPAAGEARRAILESYTKEYSAEYQAQALIDIAKRLRTRIDDVSLIAEVVIETSKHTHEVIGSGSNDPQKYDPKASRETLDHSAMYIFAVALQDGKFHHVDSYAPERATRPDTVELWRKVRTEEVPLWTTRYLSNDLSQKAFGARVVLTLKNGIQLVEELAVADAHPLGSRPFGRGDYQAKLETLAGGLIDQKEIARLLEVIDRLDRLSGDEVSELGFEVPGLMNYEPSQGIF